MNQEQQLKQSALDLFAQGNYAEAADAFARIVDLNPDSPDTHFNLGLAFAANDQVADAATAFRRSFELNPADVEAGKNLAQMLLLQEEVVEARRVLNLLHALSPEDDSIGEALSAIASAPAVHVETVPSSNPVDSRFFVDSDPRTDRLVFRLPQHWWSRPTEYQWALQFAKPGAVVLDAACGISHPLKFHLAQVCREAHACDLDERIVKWDEMLEEIARDYGISRQEIPEEVVRLPIYKHCSLTALDYPDKKFDAIFCISVLEHLTLEDFDRSIKEFARTLKDDGIIVLTFDYPRVQLDEFVRIATRAGLSFVGSYDDRMPSDALYSPEFKLHCFRAVLQKKQRPVGFEYQKYWEERYRNEGDSGLGSYGVMAEFKAEVVNALLDELNVRSVVEYGSGDGNNLRYMRYPSYIGLDVAPTAIEKCRMMFRDDPTKSFDVYQPGARAASDLPKADLVVSLDVLYHIIPDDDYNASLRDIFSSADSHVLLFTSIDAYQREPYKPGSHVRHRDTLSDLKQFPEFTIERIIEQRHPEISSAQFILLRRTGDRPALRSRVASASRRIGFVTIWFERGQSYVTKTLRDALAEEHETFIFARTGFVDGQLKQETIGMWNVPNLTTHPTYEIPPNTLQEWITANRLDTVVFNEEYDWSLVEAAKRTGVQVVTYLDYLKADWLPKMRMYDLVICSTRRSYEIVKDACSAVYVGWTVDSSLFTPRQDDGERHTFFHNAGWLGTNFRKMTPAAILAFDAMSPLVPDASFFIHFQSARDRLPQPAQDILESNPRIHTHFGTVPAPGLYHKGKVLLFPTKLEGLGLPLLEGLASGLAVIATDAPPMNEFIRHGENGLLVPVAERGGRSDGILFPEEIVDVNALAETMLTVARDAALIERLASSGRAYAVSELSWPAFRERILGLSVFARK